MFSESSENTDMNTSSSFVIAFTLSVGKNMKISF